MEDYFKPSIFNILPALVVLISSFLIDMPILVFAGCILVSLVSIYCGISDIMRINWYNQKIKD